MQIIQPDWPAADNIHAFCTTRTSPRVSDAQVIDGAYGDFNLALHVEDDAVQVKANRQQLVQQYSLPSEPVWLNQVHGQHIIDIAHNSETTPDADAAFTKQASRVCAVMTADCLPVLICNAKGNKVAAAHAGWRGLANGVIEASVAALDENPAELMVWLGPAIGPQAFEVGEEVREAFIKTHPQAAAAFTANRSGHYLADIYQLARLRLQAMGIKQVYGGDYCTFTDADRFYSYRRDGKTGRQVSLIWFD